MNNTTKTFALIGFTLAKAKDLSKAENEYIAWRAEHLLRAAKNTGAKYPASILRKSQIKQVKKALITIDEFDLMKNKQENLVEILAFILAGIDEILSHTKNPITQNLFNELADKTIWLNALIDPKMNKTACYTRADYAYQKWVET